LGSLAGSIFFLLLCSLGEKRGGQLSWRAEVERSFGFGVDRDKCSERRRGMGGGRRGRYSLGNAASVHIAREVGNAKTALECELLAVVDELVALLLVMSRAPMIVQVVEKLSLTVNKEEGQRRGSRSRARRGFGNSRVELVDGTRHELGLGEERHGVVLGLEYALDGGHARVADGHAEKEDEVVDLGRQRANRIEAALVGDL
jgi:hypothetical protein